MDATDRDALLALIRSAGGENWEHEGLAGRPPSALSQFVSRREAEAERPRTSASAAVRSDEVDADWDADDLWQWSEFEIGHQGRVVRVAQPRRNLQGNLNAIP